MLKFFEKIDKKKLKNNLLQILIFLVITLFIKIFLFQFFTVYGESMANTLHQGDLIFSYKKAFTGSLDRNEIILFKVYDKVYIKRIVGFEGDEIRIEDGFVFLKKKGEIDYTQLNEGYLSEQNFGKTFARGIKKFKVPEGSYFVLGDNRAYSSDSRTCFGATCFLGDNDYTPYVKNSQIIGKYGFTITHGLMNIFFSKENNDTEE